MPGIEADRIDARQERLDTIVERGPHRFVATLDRSRRGDATIGYDIASRSVGPRVDRYRAGGRRIVPQPEDDIGVGDAGARAIDADRLDRIGSIGQPSR